MTLSFVKTFSDSMSANRRYLCVGKCLLTSKNCLPNMKITGAQLASFWNNTCTYYYENFPIGFYGHMQTK